MTWQAPTWEKSSYSGNAHSECVEVRKGDHTLVRDTRHREQGFLSVAAPEWGALLGAVRS